MESQGVDPSKYGVNIQRENGTQTGRTERITYFLYNVGTEEADGVDLDINYQMKTGFGDFRFNNEFVYMNHYYESFYEEFGRQQVLGQFGRPRWRNNFTIGYSTGNWDIQTVARSVADAERNVRGLGKIVSPTQFDMNITYNPDWAGTFQIGGINLFNVRPRFDDTFSSKVNGSIFQRAETYYLTYRQDF